MDVRALIATAILGLAVLALLVYGVARTYYCTICIRPFAIFADGRCWQHRRRRVRA